jgi:hypothetical protein
VPLEPHEVGDVLFHHAVGVNVRVKVNVVGVRVDATSSINSNFKHADALDVNVHHPDARQFRLRAEVPRHGERPGVVFAPKRGDGRVVAGLL